MSVVKNESRPFGPVYLKASSANCSCDISGAMSSIEILQAKSVFLLIQSKENTLLGMNTYTIPKTVLHVTLLIVFV